MQAFCRATASEDTKEPASASVTPHLDDSSPGSSILADVDRARKRAQVEAIAAALNSTLWNRKQAAKLLEIDYKALLYKMKKLGIGEKTPEVSTIGVKGRRIGRRTLGYGPRND
jgi:DNA-binding NtrC family response regulator